MLGKCLKYEMKAYAKLMLPLIAVFAVSWGFEVLFMNLGFRRGDFISILMWVLIFPMLIFSLFSIPLVCSIYGAKRYNDVMFSSKAYFMRPLPVRNSTLVISVFVNSIFWFIISIALIAATFMLPTIVNDPEGFLNNLNSLLKRLFSEKEYWISTFFSMFTWMIFSELLMMTAVTLASKVNGSRLGFTFLFLIALSFGTSVIYGVLLGIFNIEVSGSAVFGNTDIVTLVFRAVLSVLMFIVLLVYADNKADVRQ